MQTLILDAWTAAVHSLCQFTVDHMPAVLTAHAVYTAETRFVLWETCDIKALLDLFERDNNEDLARMIASKCEHTFNFWARQIADLPSASAAQLGRIEKLFYSVSDHVAPAITSKDHAV